MIARLGRGGMADVFLAMRRGPVGFAKLMVLKRLREDLASELEGEFYRGLLLDEARLSARLQHPNIVQTFEVGEQDGLPFMAMEYLDGQSLDRVMLAAQRAQVELPEPLVLRMLVDVLAGLDYAHELTDYDGTPLAIVHRDISPQNVFWTYQGEIKIVDFGVAKYAHSSTHTEAGLVKGKITYMAPEQASRTGFDRRADLFSVGILMWECLANRPLMPRNNPAAALRRLLHEPMPSLAEARPALAPAITEICDRALQRDPADRYRSAAEMRLELEQVLDGSGPQRAELSRFIQRLFEQDRATLGHQIKAAMEGADILNLATTSQAASSAGAFSPTTAANKRTAAQTHPPISADPVAPRLGRPARWVALGAVATAVLMGSLVVRGTIRSRPGATSERASTASAAAALHGIPVAPPIPASPVLRLCGSNTVGAELAPALVEGFLVRKGATEVVRHHGPGPEQASISATLEGRAISIEIEARGTATAFEGLAAATCDLGMASRAIDDKEVAKLTAAGVGDLRSPGTEHVIALDGIAVIVNPSNRVRSLDRTALHDIYVGKITDWSSLGGAPGPITVLARDARSGTFDTFKNLVLGKAELLQGARRFAASEALADAVASEPSAIGFIGLAYVRSARAVAVAEAGAMPMLPTAFTVATEGYMLARRLYFYSAAVPRSPLVAELVSYALSPPGQADVARAQFIDLGLVMRDERCDRRCPRAYAAVVSRAQRVSVDFRFRTGSNEADSRAVRDLERLVSLIHEVPGARLLLLGFSDSVGGTKVNTRLSLERAQAIERELATRGVQAHLVKGFGPAMPVASNDSDSGRLRNRRVEVWLER